MSDKSQDEIGTYKNIAPVCDDDGSQVLSGIPNDGKQDH
jgi:hypothetical protein